MIHFACPHCRIGLRAKNDKVGRSTRCPKCRSPIQVPAPERDGIPPAAVKQPSSDSDAKDLESPSEQQEGNQKTGFLLLSLFVSGLVCGTVLFVVLFIKIKEARLSRPVHGEQSQGRPAADGSLLPRPPPNRPVLLEVPDEKKHVNDRRDGIVPAPEAKEEEYEAQPKKALSFPTEPQETPAVAKPPDEASISESETLIAPLVKDLRHRKVSERIKAIETVARLGAKGKAASRALCESLLDPNPKVGLAAAVALDKVNPPLQRLVIPILVDKELETRLECVRKIGQLGPEGKPAVPVLLHFKEQYPGGGLVVEVLAALAPDDRTATAKIAHWLTSDRDPYVRLAAVKALPHMADAKEHIRALVQALRADPIEAVRAAAASALGELGSEAKEVSTFLRMAKTDASAQVREAAERALAKIQK